MFDWFASRPLGDGGKRCPAASTAGEVPGDAVAADVNPENLRMNWRGMKREPASDVDEDASGGSVKPAVGRDVSSAVMGVLFASNIPGVGVVGEEGKMWSSRREYAEARLEDGDATCAGGSAGALDTRFGFGGDI